MSDTGKAALIANKKDDLEFVDGDKKAEEQLLAAAPKPDEHPGCVKRNLNFKDRNLAIHACRQKSNNGSDKDIRKYERIKKALGHEEVEEYFAMISDSYEDAEVAWLKARTLYLNQKGDKPDKKRPAPTPEEQRGKTSDFWTPSVLDAYLLEAIKACKWPSDMSEFVVELLDKYGVKDE
jgi:hypothetical protein